MTLYACFNPDGTRTTAYDDTLGYPAGTIPSTAIEITLADLGLYCEGYIRDMVTTSPTYGTPIPAPAKAPVEADYIAAAQNLLDTGAQSLGYDSMLSLASYANSTNATFKAQAAAGVAWRDAVWAEGYSILAQIKAGTIGNPTLTAFLALLPTVTWPAVTA